MMPGLSDSAVPSRRIRERWLASSMWLMFSQTVAKSEQMPTRTAQNVARDIHWMKPSGAQAIGWPIAWAVPMLPYRALGFGLQSFVDPALLIRRQ